MTSEFAMLSICIMVAYARMAQKYTGEYIGFYNKKTRRIVELMFWQGIVFDNRTLFDIVTDESESNNV